MSTLVWRDGRREPTWTDQGIIINVPVVHRDRQGKMVSCEMIVFMREENDEFHERRGERLSGDLPYHGYKCCGDCGTMTHCEEHHKDEGEYPE